jgi:crossover junction endodeoxyribonuclease RuvC
MVTVMGCDPGLASVGYSFIAVEKGNFEYIAGGVIETQKSNSMVHRLAEIHYDIEELLRDYRPKAFVVEKLFFGKNVTTAINVAQARGVILFATAEYYLGEIYEYTPPEIKKQITGDGRADKKAIRKAVKRLLKVDIKEDNACDAAAIGLCYILKEQGCIK